MVIVTRSPPRGFQCHHGLSESDSGGSKGPALHCTLQAGSFWTRRVVRAAIAVHRMAGVDEHVDERDPQPLGVGDERRQRRIEIEGDRRARRRLRRGRRFAAERRDVDRRQIEADRPREIEDLVHDPIQPRHLVVDVGDRLAQRGLAGLALTQRMERRLDDHQRIADLVRDDGRQTAERRQALFLRHLALEPHDRIGQRVEGGRQQPRVLVLPPIPVTDRDLARQIAGCRHLAHHVRDVRERARDRPRDGEAENRREQHRDDGGRRRVPREWPAGREAAPCANAGSTPPARRPREPCPRPSRGRGRTR